MTDALAVHPRSKQSVLSQDNNALQPNAVVEEHASANVQHHQPRQNTNTSGSDNIIATSKQRRWADVVVVPTGTTPRTLSTTRRFSSHLRAASRATQVQPLASPPQQRSCKWPRRGIVTPQNVRSIRPRRESFCVADTSMRRGWRHRFRPEVWLHAAQTLSILLGNSLACIACVWCATLVFSHGNVLSGLAAAYQSDFEFLVGTAVSCHLAYYSLFAAAHTPALVPLEFVVLRDRGRPTTFSFCLQRLLRHTLVAYVCSLALLISCLMLYSIVPLAFQRLRVQFYAGAFSTHVYYIGLNIALRRIFRHETVIGRSRQRLSNFQHHQSILRAITYFGRMWLRNAPMLAAVILAGLYVQLTSSYRVTGDWQFLVYTLGSLVFKFVIKEVAKIGIMRFKVQDPRTVFLVVGLPTVLVDTQVRIMLQRVQNAKYTLLWTFGMAVLEVAMRAGKVHWTKQRLQHRRSSWVLSHTAVAPIANATRSSTRAAAVVKKFGSLRDTDTHTIEWRIQTVAFQIAESYANMAAEYIAIGCSTCVVYFYWSHPKYDLQGYKTSNNNSNSSGSDSVLQLQGEAIALQLGVEVVVDYVSCVIEISEGIDFQEIRRYRAYLGFLFICIASVNVHICAMVYMDLH